MYNLYILLRHANRRLLLHGRRIYLCIDGGLMSYSVGIICVLFPSSASCTDAECSDTATAASDDLCLVNNIQRLI